MLGRLREATSKLESDMLTHFKRKHRKGRK